MHSIKKIFLITILFFASSNYIYADTIYFVDFKYVSHDPDIKSADDYVNKLISEIVSKCSAFQLEILYKPLLNKEMHTEIQIHLKEEIAHQIHQRMSVGKMVFSIMRGKKKEYDKLKNIKKTIKKKTEKLNV